MGTYSKPRKCEHCGTYETKDRTTLLRHQSRCKKASTHKATLNEVVAQIGTSKPATSSSNEPKPAIERREITQTPSSSLALKPGRVDKTSTHRSKRSSNSPRSRTSTGYKALRNGVSPPVFPISLTSPSSTLHDHSTSRASVESSADDGLNTPSSDIEDYSLSFSTKHRQPLHSRRAIAHAHSRSPSAERDRSSFRSFTDFESQLAKDDFTASRLRTLEDRVRTIELWLSLQ